MCGFVGFTGYCDFETLNDITKTIIHRGPDELGFYQDEFVNLGSARLSIIDIKSGKQPVHNESNDIWLVWNGEIYNHTELRKDLYLRGHKFYTDHSDSEVIVHLYEEFDLDFPRYLNGMFSICIWDKRKKIIILLRDRVGKKPLYYSILGKDIIFSSEIKSILKYPGFEKKPNYEAISHYFTFKNIPSPLTAFENIYSLKPGHFLIFDTLSGSFKTNYYWKPKFGESTVFITEEEIHLKIRETLEDAVKMRLVSDVPVGAFLSGGVDSAAIVTFMVKNYPGTVKTFSLGYKTYLEHKEEDIKYAKMMSKLLGTEHYEYYMTPQELVDDLPKVLKSFDQPFSGTISTYFLSKLISKHVKVALSGDGADELFGSYLAPRLAQPLYYYKNLKNKIEHGEELTEDERDLIKPFENNIELLKRLYEISDGELSKWKYELLLFKDEEKKELLTFYDEAYSSFSLLKKDVLELEANEPLNKVLELEWKTLLPDQVLAFVDHLSMAHSLEVRCPFLDYRLVELITSLPGSLKIKKGVVKKLLKDSIKGVIPNEIIDRKKEGFVLPIFWWMKSEIKGFIYDVLGEKSTQNPLIKQDYVNKLLDLYYSSEENDFNLAAKLWNLACFKIWWDLYF